MDKIGVWESVKFQKWLYSTLHIVFHLRLSTTHSCSEMELAPNNWKPMPHCSLWSSVIPKKSLLLHRLGGALFGGSKPPRFQFLFFIKSTVRDRRKKLNYKLKFIYLSISGYFIFYSKWKNKKVSEFWKNFISRFNVKSGFSSVYFDSSAHWLSNFIWTIVSIWLN